MTKLARVLTAIALCTLGNACVSYSSIQKVDNQVYLSGGTNYFVMTVPFLKRCDVDGQILRCEELKEFDVSRRANDPAAPGAAPPPAAAPAAPPPAAAPAPAAPAAKPAGK